MSDKEKIDLILGVIAAATLPQEMERELMGFVITKSPAVIKAKDFSRGAKAMRRKAVRAIRSLESGCMGAQKAAFVEARRAVEALEVLGCGEDR